MEFTHTDTGVQSPLSPLAPASTTPTEAPGLTEGETGEGAGDGATATTATAATAATTTTEVGCIGPKLAPFNPAGEEVLCWAMQMLDLTPADLLYDLGCGDARFLVKACTEVGLRGVGVEYDASVLGRARLLLAGASQDTQSRVSLLHANVLDVDLSPATAMFIYLVPEGIKMLRGALLEALERGVRIVTYVFSIPGVEPREVRLHKGSTKVYLYKKE
ncbi:hypothetical protein B484DRAFT_441709 [Ochromonadaceae sp. CCMP2298]|nr:hypothetical protein B484DRAFT_441709 [Ochromonadaceae sp. CCMP2298]